MNCVRHQPREEARRRRGSPLRSATIRARAREQQHPTGRDHVERSELTAVGQTGVVADAVGLDVGRDGPLTSALQHDQRDCGTDRRSGRPSPCRRRRDGSRERHRERDERRNDDERDEEVEPRRACPTDGTPGLRAPTRRTSRSAKCAAKSSGTEANGQSVRSRTCRNVSMPTTPTATAPTRSASGEKHMMGQSPSLRGLKPPVALLDPVETRPGPGQRSAETGHPTSVRRSAGSSASATR